MLYYFIIQDAADLLKKCGTEKCEQLEEKKSGLYKKNSFIPRILSKMKFIR